MSRKSSVATCALLLLLSAAAITPDRALAETVASCLPFVEAQQYIFSVWGESEHWAVILEGLGTCRDGRIETAEALPHLVWTGGGESPQQATVTFTVEDVTCINGTYGIGPLRVHRVPDCKLVFPGQGLLVASRPDQLVRAITTEGKFVITWNGHTEQITWLYGYPPARNDSRDDRDSHKR